MWKPGKVVSILLWVISIISVILAAYVFYKCSGLSEKSPEDRSLMAGIINPMFIWIYILLIITALAAVVMPLPQLIKNPKGLIRMVLGVVAFGVVILIAFAMAKTDALPFSDTTKKVTEGTLKFADVNLYSMYIMFALTVITVLFSSVFVNLLRRK